MWKLSRLRYAGMLVLFGLAAHAQEPAVETLAGVDSVYILAEHTSELLAQVGLSDTILAERATDILARARLVLSSHDQWLESAGGVYLYVRADAAAAQGSSTAAYVAVVSELVLLIPFYIGVRRYLAKIPWLPILWRQVASGAPMVILAILLPPQYRFFAVLLGLALYVGGLLLLGAYNVEERRVLRSVIPLRRLLARLRRSLSIRSVDRRTGGG